MDFFRKLKTEKQRELAEYLLFTGLSAKEIGLELNIAESTVQNRANMLYKIMGYSNRNEMQADYINYLERKLEDELTKSYQVSD